MPTIRVTGLLLAVVFGIITAVQVLQMALNGVAVFPDVALAIVTGAITVAGGWANLWAGRNGGRALATS